MDASDSVLSAVGGEVAKAFTNAFVHAKVVEIQSQLDKCWSCSCSLNGPLCEPVANFSLCMAEPGKDLYIELVTAVTQY